MCAHSIYAVTTPIIQYSRQCTEYISESDLELDGLLVLKLPPCPIRGSEAELVAVQLNFDAWAIQHSPRPSQVAVPIISSPASCRNGGGN